MADANPFTDDVTNGARFAAALINEGTAALRDEFDQQVVSSRFGSLQSALNDAAVKNLVKDFQFGRNRKPKILTRPQHQLLYPHGQPAQQSDGFDITLLSFLLLNILPEIVGVRTPIHPKTYTGTYAEMKDHIIELRTLRNDTYGHIITTAISPATFEQHFDKLEEILLCFSVSQSKIDEWKEKTLSETEIKEYENQIKSLCDNDITFKEDLLKLMDKSSKSLLQSQLQAAVDVKSKIKLFQAQVEDKINFSRKQTAATIKSKTNDSQKQILDLHDQTIQKLDGQLEAHIDHQIERSRKQLVEKIDISRKQTATDNESKMNNSQKQDLELHKQMIQKAVKDIENNLKENVTEPMKKHIEENVTEPLKQHMVENVTEPIKRHMTKLLQTETEKSVFTTQEIKQHLIDVYRQKQLNAIQVLPGEKFRLDLEKSDLLMPVDFSAMERKCDERDIGVIPFEEMKVWYDAIVVDKIEEIISKIMEQDGSSRLVLCTSPAGCGKTVYSRYLVTEWMKQSNPLLKSIDILLVIPIRNVQFIGAELTEIFGSGSTGLGYMNNEMINSLTAILNDTEKALNLLICLDGIDEKTIPEETELFKLITAEVYPNAKVFITSRPEATILESVKKLNPKIKVKINGTTKEGVKSYLENRLTHKDGCDQKEEVDLLIKRCQEQMVEPHLLQVPLYLTIMGYLFDSHWKDHWTLKQFIVPDTVTKLFIALLNILLRVWDDKLDSSNSSEGAKKLKFCQSPLDETSNVPPHMKRILYHMSKMSYHFILNQNYNFTKPDLDEYFIDFEDLKSSGLFSFTDNNEEIVAFYRHKQMQEFMAAVYLCKQKFNEKSFSKMIEGTVQNSKRYSLIETFNGLETVSYFVFGLSPEFAVEILNKLKGHLCVPCLILYGKPINIHFESLLCFEANDSSVSNAMREVLVGCLPVVKICLFTSPVITVHSLYEGLTPEQTQTLLKSWYGLVVYKKGEHWAIKADASNKDNEKQNFTSVHPFIGDKDSKLANTSTYSTELSIPYLNVSLYVLLCQCTFPAVKSLKVTLSDICEVSPIAQIFPQLQQLDMGWTEITKLDVFVNKGSTTNPQNTLTQIYIHNKSLRYTDGCVVSLFQQTQLQSLVLRCLDLPFFVFFNAVQPEVKLPQLCILHINTDQLHENCTEVYSALTRLLERTPRLQSLTLGSFENYIPITQSVSLMSNLLQAVTSKLTALTTLRLYGVFSFYSNELQPSDIQSVCCHLQQFPALTTLGLDWKDIVNWKTEWLENLNTLPQLHTLQVINRLEFNVQSLVTTLQEHHLRRNLHIEAWEWEVDGKCCKV